MFCFSILYSNFTGTFIPTFCLAIKKGGCLGGSTFELGPTLFEGPKEAKLPEPLSHSSIHLAVSVTVSESLIKLSLTENCKESSGLFIAPVHTCYLLILKRRLFNTPKELILLGHG
uniref:Uncharacterized protein n=1 Tax=Panthera tigris altaica TaxID=74533 RepID=A0A8C9KPP7_PANTA